MRCDAGFSNAMHAIRYIPVNLVDLNQFDDGAKVDEAALKAIGLANGKGAGIKILGNGDLQKKLSISVSAVSAAARQKIEARGGTCEIVGKKSAAK